jgi:hypothetical protein
MLEGFSFYLGKALFGLTVFVGISLLAFIGYILYSVYIIFKNTYGK